MMKKSSTSIWPLILFIAFSVHLGTVENWAQSLNSKPVVCGQCQHKNESDYSFCINCGLSLSKTKEAGPTASQQKHKGIEKKNSVATAEDSLSRKASKHPQKKTTNPLEKAASQKIRGIKIANQVDERPNKILLADRPNKKPAAAARFQVSSPKGDARTKRWIKKMLAEPTELPRLFNVPTAEVLGSLDLYFNGGGAFGLEKERNFLGRAAMGLGDIAEVEFATESVINTLQRGSSSLPTSAFKMQVMKEQRALPAVAAALRSTTSWQHLVGSDPQVSFETRLTKLYLVSTKRFGNITAHFGLGLTDVRVRNPQGFNILDSESRELQNNLWAPFGGISIQANQKARFMFEIEGLPSYDFNEGESYRGSDIKNIWAGVVGVRFYFANWLVTDTGVRYRSDFDGIADATIQASVNVLLPISRLRNNNKSNEGDGEK